MMYTATVGGSTVQIVRNSHWPKDAVGHRMTAKVPVAREEDTIGDVRRTLRGAHGFEMIKVQKEIDEAIEGHGGWPIR